MSQMELRSVPALKKEIIRLALAAAVQLLFALWFYAFCCGLLSLGPLRLPYGVKGYEFGGMVCVLTAFMPVRTVWNLNEAVDEAKKHEPLDFDALLPRMAEICSKALRELPRALVLIPLLFLVEWMQAGTLNSIPMAVVYALLILMDFLLFRRFLTLRRPVPIPERGLQQGKKPPEGTAPDGNPVLRSREQTDDLRSLQNGARNFMILGAVELIVVAIPLVQAGLSLQMISLRPRLTANILTLLVCGWLGVKIILHSWEVYQRVGVLHSDDGKDLITQKLGDLAAQLGTAREKIMMTALIAPLALLADVFRSESAAALPWFGLAVVYYLLFELLWRRYKKQVDQVMAEA